MALNSINLTSGMRANLYSLQKTAKDLETTQQRLATGLRINNALDDPVKFFTAQEHRLRASDLASRKDGMSEAIQTIKAANVGIEGITNLIAQAKSLASSALSASASDAEAFATQFAEVLNQIDTIANDSGYKGVNLLRSGELTVQFAQSADDSVLKLDGFGGATGTFIGSFGAQTTVTTGAGWVDASGEIVASAIESDIEALEDANEDLRTESKNLSSDLSIITAREDFTSKMINTLEDGAATLTEADMNEEGANMLMLQTRQALGTTSLSLASQAAQSVLRLF